MDDQPRTKPLNLRFTAAELARIDAAHQVLQSAFPGVARTRRDYLALAGPRFGVLMAPDESTDDDGTGEAALPGPNDE